MKLIGDGVLLGFLLSFMTGPIFFSLIETSIKRGFKAAIFFCSGVWISDLIFISIVFLGLTFIKDFPNFNFYVGIIGGILLCIFGLVAFFNKTEINTKVKTTAKSNFGDFLKGIAINVFNPFVILFWIGIIGNLTKKEINVKNSVLFLTSLLLTVAISDILKAYLAQKIRNRITPQYLKILNIVVGVGLISCGIVLIYRVL